MNLFKLLVCVPAVGALGCMDASTDSSPLGEAVAGEPTSAPFGTTKAGEAATAWTLKNSSGMEIVVTDFGATLVSVRLPDRDGKVADVILGFDDVTGYEGEGNQYFGCTVGRVSNRIAKGKFELDGSEYSLAINNEPNTLHGGDVGFSARLWERVDEGQPGTLTFKLVSEDGDEGYPGRLEATSSFMLTESGCLQFTMTARSDAATPVSLTNHAYWNLGGQGAETVLDHELELAADGFTPTDDTLIPTGVIDEPTPDLDFRSAKAIGRDLDAVVETAALGFDHNYVLFEGASRRAESTESRVAAGTFDARLRDPASGRTMELFTDQPGLQFYSGNFLFGQEGKGGAKYPLRSACCLEPQGIPNAINEPRFPSVVISPGDTYSHTTVLRFAAK